MLGHQNILKAVFAKMRRRRERGRPGCAEEEGCDSRGFEESENAPNQSNLAERGRSKFAGLGISAKLADGAELRNILRAKQETLIRAYNTVSSGNARVRTEIDALRRERTLFDSVFKDLEKHIRAEEAAMLEVLRKTVSADADLAAVESNAQGIRDTVQAAPNDVLHRIIADHKHAYSQNIKRATRYSQLSIRANLAHPQEVVEPVMEEPKVTPKTADREPDSRPSRQSRVEGRGGTKIKFLDVPVVEKDEHAMAQTRRILRLEKLITDFRLRAEENDLDRVLTVEAGLEDKIATMKADIEAAGLEVGSEVRRTGG